MQSTGTQWTYAVASGPWASPLDDFAGAITVSPDVRIRMDKPKPMRSPLPDDIDRLRRLWTTGMEVRTGIASPVCLQPCIECGIDSASLCVICLLPWHPVCSAKQKARLLVDTRLLGDEPLVIAYPSTLLPEARLRLGRCELCASFIVAQQQ